MQISTYSGNEEIIHTFQQFDVVENDDYFYIASGDSKVKIPSVDNYWISQMQRTEEDFMAMYQTEVMALGIE